MRDRIAAYIRQHHLALVCLFLIVASGTAWALERNSVLSRHIVDDTVRGRDVRESSLKRLDADVLIASFGPLPLEGEFKSGGGDLLIIASGQGARVAGTTGLVGMDIKLDGNVVGQSQAAVVAGQSETFTTEMQVVSAPAGAHTIRLEALPQTGTGPGFPYHVSAIELP